MEINYSVIKNWVKSRYANWEYEEDLIQFIALSLLEGRHTAFRWLYYDFCRKYLRHKYLELKIDPPDPGTITENLIIAAIDRDRPKVPQVALKRGRPKHTALDHPKRNSDWIKALPVGLRLRDVEYQFIIETLRQYDGNRTVTAKILGISVRSLRNKIAEIKVLQCDTT